MVYRTRIQPDYPSVLPVFPLFYCLTTLKTHILSPHLHTLFISFEYHLPGVYVCVCFLERKSENGCNAHTLLATPVSFSLQPLCLFPHPNMHAVKTNTCNSSTRTQPHELKQRCAHYTNTHSHIHIIKVTAPNKPCVVVSFHTYTQPHEYSCKQRRQVECISRATQLLHHLSQFHLLDTRKHACI